MIKFVSSILFAFLAAIIFTSCNDRNIPAETYFTENISVYAPDDVVTDTLDGHIMLTEIIGAQFVKEGFGLLAINCRNKSKMISVYTSSGDSIGEYCMVGQGPDDFINADIVKFSIAENGDTCLWLNDISNKMVKRLNLSMSRRMNSTKIDSTISTELGAINVIMPGDMLVYEIMDNDAYKLKYRDLSDANDTLHCEQMYIYPTKDFYAYYSLCDASPDNRFMAIGMAYFNQLNIIDFTDMSRKAVSIGNVKSYDECYDSKNRDTKYIGYGSVACGADCIYAIYFGKDVGNDDSYSEPTTTTIHAINYDGTINKAYIINNILRSIGYDSSDNSLLAIDNNDNIIKFQLK